MPLDVLIVSLGATAGLREADRQLADALEHAGAKTAIVAAQRPREVRTFALTDLAWAVAARRAAIKGIERYRPRSIVYSSSTAALLWPRPGAIRFDAPAAGNRPGRHGTWQRRVERRRFAEASLLVPWSEGGLAEAPPVSTQAIVLPVATAAFPNQHRERQVTAVTYAVDERKKGLDRVLAAWREVSTPEERLIVVGADRSHAAGNVSVEPLLDKHEYLKLLQETNIFVTAPRREDYGIAQLDALASGCQLVTTPAPGPYAALPIAKELDGRLVDDDLSAALEAALRSPLPEYRERASRLSSKWRQPEIDRVVAERLLPALLAGKARTVG